MTQLWLAIISAAARAEPPVLNNLELTPNEKYAVFAGYEGYTFGPPAVGQSMFYIDLHNWIVRIVNGNEIHIGVDGGPLTNAYTHTNPLDHVSMTFDVNGGLVFTFVSMGDVFVRFFNSLIQQIDTINLGPGSDPHVCPTTFNTIMHLSEILLVYVKAGEIVYRRQIDRYDTEYQLGVQDVEAILTVGHDINDSLVVVYVNTLGEVKELYTASLGYWLNDTLPGTTYEGSIVELTVAEAIADITDVDVVQNNTYSGAIVDMELQDVLLLTAQAEDTQTTSYVGSVVSMDMLEARVDINIVEESPAEMLIADPVVTALTATKAQARIEHDALEEAPSEMLISDMVVSALSGSLTTIAPSLTSTAVSENYITLSFDKYIRTPSNTDGWSAMINGVTPITLVFDSIGTALSSVSGYIRFTYIEPITNTDVLTMSYDSVLGGVYLLADITDLVINNVVGQGVPAKYLTTDNYSGLVLTENDTVATYPSSNTQVRANVENAMFSGKWFIEYEALVVVRPTIAVSHSYPSVQNGQTPTYTATDGMAVYMPVSGSGWRRYYLTEGGSVTYDNLVSQPPLVAGDRITVGYDVDLREMTLCVNGNVVGTWTQSSTVSAGPAHMAVALIQGDSLRISDAPLFPIPGYSKWEGLTTVDTYAANVSSLMRFNDIDGSTLIADDTGKTWTVEGDAQISTAQSVDGGSSLLLSGTGSLLSASSADFAYLEDDFTIEMHVWVNAFSGNLYALDHGSNNGALNTASQSRFKWYNPTTGLSSPLYTAGTGVLNAQQWYHIAIVRSAGVTSVYTDGVLMSQGADAYSYSYQTVTVGRHGAGTSYNFNGHIDNVRITKGVARYTGNFTPPTAPYPLIT